MILYNLCNQYACVARFNGEITKHLAFYHTWCQTSTLPAFSVLFGLFLPTYSKFFIYNVQMHHSIVNSKTRTTLTKLLQSIPASTLNLPQICISCHYLQRNLYAYNSNWNNKNKKSTWHNKWVRLTFTALAMSLVNGGTMPNITTTNERANTKQDERIINLFTPTH